MHVGTRSGPTNIFCHIIQLRVDVLHLLSIHCAVHDPRMGCVAKQSEQETARGDDRRVRWSRRMWINYGI